MVNKLLGFSKSWAGPGPTLVCNVEGAPRATGEGFTGYFAVSAKTFEALGSVVDMDIAQDENGDKHSTEKALVSFAPIVNGKKGKAVPAKATFVMSELADGTETEGIEIVNYTTGALLYTTGRDAQGAIVQLPVTHGSVTISLND